MYGDFAPAALGDDRARRAESVGGVEDLGDLRQTGDPGEERDLLPLQPERLAGAVPVLVEAAHGLRRGRRAADHRNHRRAPLAACLDDLLPHRLQPAQGPQQLPGAGELRHPRTRVAGREGQHLGNPLVVDALEAALQGEVVGREQLAHPRGAVRAPRVLQKQRVHQRLTLVGVDAEARADLHADRAGALGMPDRLALGEIQGVRQGGDHLGEAQPEAVLGGRAGREARRAHRRPGDDQTALGDECHGHRRTIGA